MYGSEPCHLNGVATNVPDRMYIAGRRMSSAWSVSLAIERIWVVQYDVPQSQLIGSVGTPSCCHVVRGCKRLRASSVQAYKRKSMNMNWTWIQHQLNCTQILKS